jgi:hypothetical protein
VTVQDTTLSATTDATGAYRLTGVAPGTLTLTASAAGFAARSQAVSVTVGATATLDFSLTPIVVIGPRPLQF